MKKLQVALSVLIVCYSCGNPFLGNAYSGIDSYQPPSAEQLTTVAGILKELADTNFLDYLSKNSDTTTKVAETLQNEVNSLIEKKNTGSIDEITDEEKHALIALTEVDLAANNADDPLRTLDALTGDAQRSGVPVLTQSSELLEKIIKTDNSLSSEEKEASITMQLDALLRSMENFKLYQEINTDADGNYNSPGNPVFSDDVIARKALYSTVTAYIVQNIEIDSISQEIISANPTATQDELRKIALVKALANEELIPSYTYPAGYDKDSQYVSVAQAMLEEYGLDKIVNDGLTLLHIVYFILGE